MLANMCQMLMLYIYIYIYICVRIPLPLPDPVPVCIFSCHPPIVCIFRFEFRRYESMALVQDGQMHRQQHMFMGALILPASAKLSALLKV